MASFSQLAKGTRARRRIALPLGDTKADPAEATGWTGEVTELDVRALLPSEEADVLERAYRFAKERGLGEPSPDDPLYEFGIQLHRVAIACIDKDSPEHKPAPFFDGGVGQILASEALTRDHIAYLYEHAIAFQNECSPRVLRMDPEAFLEATVKTAGGDMLPFLQLRPGTQWSFARSLAVLALSSLQSKSPYGATSEPVSST